MNSSLRHYFFISLSLLLIIILINQCSNSNKTKEGSIEYDISYPCLEKSSNSLMFFLPKKMVTTFKDDCFKNKFIFSNANSKLEAISNCKTKDITLAFGYGKSMKYTKLDSTSIHILLDELPTYSKLSSSVDSINYLNNSSLNYDVTSSKNDSIFNVITTNEIEINDMNWCTPFNQINEVMLEYKLNQYGIEMKFKATKINKIKVDNDFLELDPNYSFLEIKKYLKEVKGILSIFSCQ